MWRHPPGSRRKPKNEEEKNQANEVNPAMILQHSSLTTLMLKRRLFAASAVTVSNFQCITALLPEEAELSLTVTQYKELLRRKDAHSK
jgi:hypothetical protein